MAVVRHLEFAKFAIYVTRVLVSTCDNASRHEIAVKSACLLPSYGHKILEPIGYPVVKII